MKQITYTVLVPSYIIPGNIRHHISSRDDRTVSHTFRVPDDEFNFYYKKLKNDGNIMSIKTENVE